ncbi:hypothetical protein MMC28_006997 [Mycoblastus sanguinarius]|nr:hypothetical protein [Mycoblastus sanguinarius]
MKPSIVGLEPNCQAPVEDEVLAIAEDAEGAELGEDSVVVGTADDEMIGVVMAIVELGATEPVAEVVVEVETLEEENAVIGALNGALFTGTGTLGVGKTKLCVLVEDDAAALEAEKSDEVATASGESLGVTLGGPNPLPKPSQMNATVSNSTKARQYPSYVMPVDPPVAGRSW